MVQNWHWISHKAKSLHRANNCDGFIYIIIPSDLKTYNIITLYEFRKEVKKDKKTPCIRTLEVHTVSMILSQKSVNRITDCHYKNYDLPVLLEHIIKHLSKQPVWGWTWFTLYIGTKQ